jgi:hypothetical protein
MDERLFVYTITSRNTFLLFAIATTIFRTVVPAGEVSVMVWQIGLN